MDGNKFTPQQIERFSNDRVYYKSFIKATEEQVNALFKVVILPSVSLMSFNE